MNKAFVLVLLGIACTQGTFFGALYSPKDDVEILTGYNFNKFIQNSPTGWLVNFYNTSSNQSQVFASIWKEFATDAASWRDLVRVGVIDCSNAKNARICNDLPVYPYPSVSYFHAHGMFRRDSSEHGISIGETLDLMKRNIINFFAQEIVTSHGRELVEYPRSIVPLLDSNQNELFRGENKDIRYVILVIEDYIRPLGAEMALHFRKTPHVAFKRSLAANLIQQQQLKIESLPHIIITDRNNNVEVISDGVNGTKSMKWVLTKYLKLKGINPVVVIPRKLDKMPQQPKSNNYVIIQV